MYESINPTQFGNLRMHVYMLGSLKPHSHVPVDIMDTLFFLRSHMCHDIMCSLRDQIMMKLPLLLMGETMVHVVPCLVWLKKRRKFHCQETHHRLMILIHFNKFDTYYSLYRSNISMI